MIEVAKSDNEIGLEPDDDGVGTISAKSGMTFRRKAYTPPPSPYLHALNASVGDGVAPSLAPNLAEAFRGRYATVAKIIRSSKSRGECEIRLKAWALSEGGGDVQDIIAQGLTAYSLGGINSATK